MASDLALSPPGFDAASLRQAQAQAALSNTGAPALGGLRGKSGPDLQAIGKAAQEFESVFIGQMLSLMQEGIKTNELFGGGHGEEMFRGLLIEEQGKVIAKSGGFGLADDIKRQMLRLQEVADRQSTSSDSGELP